MKKFIVAGLLFFAATAFAQDASYNGQVLFSGGFPYPTVRVCTEPAVGTPCTPLASIYSDPALTQPLPNPFTGGATGQYTFYAITAGTYHVQVSGSGLTSYDLAYVTLGGGGGSGNTPGGPTNSLQYNCSPLFCGSSGLTYTPTTGPLAVTAYSTLGLQVGATSGITAGASGLLIYGSDTSPSTLALNVLNQSNSTLFSVADSGLATVNYEDLIGVNSPYSNPPVGRCRLQFNLTTGQTTGTNSSGGSCLSSGGGGSIGGSGTANTLAMFTASTTLGNSPISLTGSVLTTADEFQVSTTNTTGVEGFATPATCTGTVTSWLITGSNCTGTYGIVTTPAASSGATAGVFGLSQANFVSATTGNAFMAGVVGEGYFSQNNVTANANWVAGTVGIGWDIGGQSGIVNVTSGLVGLAYNASPNTLSLLDAVDAEVENVGGTLPQAATYYARSPNFTSTVNNHYGFLMQDQTVGGGNNLTPHGFWELGAAPNQFAATTFTGAVTFNITGATAQCAQLSTVGVISGTGAPCSSLVIQTNGTNNATQSTLNLQPSTTNAVGLTVSPTYHSGGAEQFEITGGSYTGNAATATQLATTPINCGPGSAAIGITANGNATGCFAPGGLSGLTQYGMLYATSTTTGASAGPGLIGQTYVSDGTSGPPTLQGAGVVPRVVTSGGMDTILADNSTTLQDRGKVIVDCTGSTIVETVPDAGTSGMGGNFVFSIDVSDGSVSGTPCTASTLVTVNRTATSVFYVSNGLTANTAVNTFSLYPGQRALFNSDNTNWYVQINVPTSLTTNSGGTPTYLAAFSSGVNLVNATEHNVSLMRACNDTSGSATAQSCTPVNTTSGTLQANDELIYTTTTTNTGALTIAVSGGSALPVKKWSSGTLAALVANDIKAGEPVLLVYDGTNLIIPSAGNSGGSGGSPALSSVTALTSSTSISNGAFGWTLQNSLTGASSCELCVTESAASTGGTSGVQAGISVTTATGSTETPLYINQGILDATNPTVPAVNIVGDWSNSGIVGPLVAITVTNTSSTSGSCILSLTAGSLGTTLSHCLDTLGNVRAGGTYEGTVYNELTEFSGGLGSVSANSAAGGGLFKGSDNQNAGTAARGGGLYAIAGGLVTSSPNAAAMEGVLQLGEQGQKGAGTIAAAYDVLCSTSTAFVYNDCPTGATNIVGIAATATNPIGLVQGGQSPVNLDNTATNGDTVCTSATTAWDGHDNGTSACVYPQVQIGTVVSVAGSLTLYTSGQATTTQALSTSLPLVHLMWSTPTAPGVVATTKQKSETGADTGVLTYTTPSAAANYRVCLTESFSAASSATIGWTLTWTDSNGNAQTPTNEPLTQSGTAAPALTFTTSTAGNYAGCVNIDTNNAGANIVVKTTFSGTSMASKVSATIERMI